MRARGARLRRTVFAASPGGTVCVAAISCSSATRSSATSASANRVAMRAEAYARRGERRAVEVGRASVGRSLVQWPPLHVERAELRRGRARAAGRRTRLDSQASSGLTSRWSTKARSASAVRVVAEPSPPPPISTTASGRRASASSAASSSSSRNARSPRSANTSATCEPVRSSTSRSTETNGRPRRSASFGPSVDLPAPMKPTSATCRSSALRAATRFARGRRRAR